MRASECDILILPGFHGGTPDHWYARWAAKLSTAHRVEQRDFEHPALDEWTGNIARAAGAAKKPVVLIGHSLGALAGAFTAPDLDNVIAAMFVAPPAPDKIRENAQIDPAFAERKLRKLAFPSLLVASRNDPWSSYVQAEERAATLGATLVDAGEAGHINPDSGHGPWPEGLLRFAHFLSAIKMA
ncbi:MAG: serine hydrolase family protein [Hyphomicrobiales bacterium]|nr:serine hydrolase family protein [Hyphomicrobiales bacterium]